MKNAFEKYFLSIVFILISGFALLHANSFFDDNYNFNDVNEIYIANHTNAQYQIHPSSDSNTGYTKTFIELTESEELELLSKGKKGTLINAGSIFAFCLYIFIWQINFKKALFSSAPTNGIGTILCKRYIQFEVFRI